MKITCSVSLEFGKDTVVQVSKTMDYGEGVRPRMPTLGVDVEEQAFRCLRRLISGSFLSKEIEE